MKVLRTATALLAVLALAAPSFAGREDDADRKSKNGMTKGTVAGVEVAIEYGMPMVRERAIWGELVPMAEVWRTGADEATTITLSGDIVVEGEPLAAGTYSLFTIPRKGEWTVIFNKVAEQWGAYDYDAGQDALRVDVEPRMGDHVEAMDFVVDDSGIALRWEKVVVPVRMSAAQ